MKIRSTFFTEENISKFRKNSQGTEIREYVLENVKKWDAMSMDELWELMYSSDLMRSHEVMKSSRCPACGESNNWKTDPFTRPWKVLCTHCREEFPKNDFHRYYLSGLDEQHKFRYGLADGSLLYNKEAPDPDDPKHRFGVDDGRGYYEGGARWLFIAYYIQAGIWAEQMIDGIKTLARAYIMTGEKRYARKCGIMIDRIADLFPEFDFYEQGFISEEEFASRGYVAYWCESVRQIQYMLLAYDAIFEFIRSDEEFLSFVAEKSEKFKTPCRKSCFQDIQINIETRIFKEAAAEKWKIAANFPFAENYIIFSKMVLTRWPDKPEDMKWVVYCVLWWAVENEIKYVVENATRANGMSGEKGFTGYSRIAMDELARMLSIVGIYDDRFFDNIVKRYPGILEGIHLCMNSWLLGSFYPGTGDSGGSGAYVNKGIPLGPSYSSYKGNKLDSTILYSFDSFLWKLYKATDDIDILRYMYNAENYDNEKLFSTDLTLDANPCEIRKEYLSLIEKHGAEIRQRSINAEQQKLMVLHSGSGEHKRSAVLDCDSGGVHGHNDGMNIELYAHGANYMPDLSTPPHHRGGNWYSRFYYWHRSAASHNTVIVDRREHRDFCYTQRDVNGGQGLICESGETVLWSIGSWVKAGASNDPMIIGERAKRFERMLAVVDLTEEDSYFFDIFRVKGGKEHVKLTKTFICDMETNGQGFRPYTADSDPYGMCFINDKNPEENFNYSIDGSFKLIRDTMIAGEVQETFRADFRYTGKYDRQLGWPEGRENTLRYFDLTASAEYITFTSFFDTYGLALSADKDLVVENGNYPEEMLPGVAVMRKASSEGELESIFIGVYEGAVSDHKVRSARRLFAGADQNSGAAAFVVETIYGRDLIMAADAENRGVIEQKDWSVRTDASLCVIRKSSDGRIRYSMTDGSFLEIGKFRVDADPERSLTEGEYLI